METFKIFFFTQKEGSNTTLILTTRDLVWIMTELLVMWIKFKFFFFAEPETLTSYLFDQITFMWCDTGNWFKCNKQ